MSEALKKQVLAAGVRDVFFKSAWKPEAVSDGIIKVRKSKVPCFCHVF